MIDGVAAADQRNVRLGHCGRCDDGQNEELADHRVSLRALRLSRAAVDMRRRTSSSGTGMEIHRIMMTRPALTPRSVQNSERRCGAVIARSNSTVAQRPTTHGIESIQPSITANAAVLREPCSHSVSSKASPKTESKATCAATATG